MGSATAGAGRRQVPRRRRGLDGSRYDGRLGSGRYGDGRLGGGKYGDGVFGGGRYAATVGWAAAGTARAGCGWRVR